MSDEQIEAYANLKAQNERGQSAKLAAWERGSAGGGLDMLQAMVQGQTDLQAIQANGANPARPAQGGANTVTDWAWTLCGAGRNRNPHCDAHGGIQ